MEKCTLELGNLISVEPKDFINLWDEMRQNFVKTESEELRKLLLSIVNFHLSFGQNLSNFCPFFMPLLKVGKKSGCI